MSHDRRPDPAGDGGGVVQRRVTVYPDGTLKRLDAALYLGLSGSCLAHHARRGTGPKYFVFRGKSFYRRTDLDAWKASLSREVDPRQPLLPADAA
ncbi:MAG: hypothetical protein WAS73_00035 [Defluviicoccus sp.]